MSARRMAERALEPAPLPELHGEECTYCRREAECEASERAFYEEERAVRAARPSWEIHDEQRRPYCSHECRVRQVLHEHGGAAQLVQLYEALIALVDVPHAAWQQMERVEGLFAVGERHGRTFVSARQFRACADAMLTELGCVDEEPRWVLDSRKAVAA